MIEKAIQYVQTLDPEGLLQPYLESNAREFFSSGEKLPDNWTTELGKWISRAGLDDDCRDELLGLAEHVEGDFRLSFLWFHCSRLAYGINHLYPSASIMKWPSFGTVSGTGGPLFLLLIALSAVPKIKETHSSLGIPEDVTADTCRDVASRNEIMREFSDNANGVSNTCVAWLRLHASGELFQLGRLQFHPCIVAQPIRAYRRRSDGRVLLVAEGGQRFTEQGYFDGAGEMLDKNGWFSELSVSGQTITAHSFTDGGLARKRPVTLDLDEWHLAADASSTVMNTHIPRGEKLNVAQWYDSVRRGFDFFREFRPATAPFAACFCTSWIFDPRLQEFLPETSNLVKLQKNVSLFPLCSAGVRSGFTFIFGDNDIDLATAPRDTSLRRAVIDFVSGGGRLSGGGMFLFEDQVRRT